MLMMFNVGCDMVCLESHTVLSMVEYGGRQNNCHINKPMGPIAPLLWTLLHKFPVVVVLKSTTPFHHDCHLTTVVSHCLKMFL